MLVQTEININCNEIHAEALWEKVSVVLFEGIILKCLKIHDETTGGQRNGHMDSPVLNTFSKM